MILTSITKQSVSICSFQKIMYKLATLQIIFSYFTFLTTVYNNLTHHFHFYTSFHNNNKFFFFLTSIDILICVKKMYKKKNK